MSRFMELFCVATYIHVVAKFPTVIAISGKSSSPKMGISGVKNTTDVIIDVTSVTNNDVITENMPAMAYISTKGNRYM